MGAGSGAGGRVQAAGTEGRVRPAGPITWGRDSGGQREVLEVCTGVGAWLSSALPTGHRCLHKADGRG